MDPEDTEEGKNVYLKADYSVDCSSERYEQARIVAICFILIYPIGVPIVMYYKLLVASKEIKRGWGPKAEYEDEKKQLVRMALLAPLEHLFRNFKPKRWYWEVCERWQCWTFHILLTDSYVDSGCGYHLSTEPHVSVGSLSKPEHASDCRVHDDTFLQPVVLSCQAVQGPRAAKD